MPKLNPLHDYVLVRRAIDETKSTGGIIIPDNAQKKSTRAEVLAVGPGSWTNEGTRAPMGVKPGDVVLLSQWSGTSVDPRDDGRTMLVRESEILGVEDWSANAG